MDIRFHEKLYRNGISKRKLASISRKIQQKSPKLNLFLVTLPLGRQGILEVYWYPELLQRVYQQMDEELIVVGLAKTREEAFLLVEQIIMDIGVKKGEIPVKQFFEEKQ